MKKEVNFADEPTKNLFKNLSHAFQARNRHRDSYMDYEEEVVIDGFEDHVIAYVDPLKKEWWILSWYWIFSALLLSSILRWMIVKELVSCPWQFQSRPLSAFDGSFRRQLVHWTKLFWNDVLRLKNKQNESNYITVEFYEPPKENENLNFEFRKIGEFEKPGVK